MAELRPKITVTVDTDIRAELDRMKREEAVNVSGYINHLLRLHFIKKPARQKGRKTL